MKRIGSVAYRLPPAASSRLDPDFHASQLKAMVGNQLIETKFPRVVVVRSRIFSSMDLA